MSEHLTPEGEQFLGLQGFEKGREHERTALLTQLRAGVGGLEEEYIVNEGFVLRKPKVLALIATIEKAGEGLG